MSKECKEVITHCGYAIVVFIGCLLIASTLFNK